jgi:hypothetical protein
MRRGGSLLLLAACGGPWSEVSFVDEGELCISQEGDGIRIVVDAPECLSSSCSRNPHGTCDATVHGDRITVTSEISWEEHHGRLAECTHDCGRATAECTIDELMPGAYTVVLGDAQQQIVLPVMEGCPT